MRSERLGMQSPPSWVPRTWKSGPLFSSSPLYVALCVRCPVSLVMYKKIGFLRETTSGTVSVFFMSWFDSVSLRRRPVQFQACSSHVVIFVVRYSSSLNFGGESHSVHQASVSGSFQARQTGGVSRGNQPNTLQKGTRGVKLEC